MSYADGRLVLASELVLEDFIASVEVAVRFHSAGNAVCIEAVEFNGYEVPLSQADLEAIADHIAGLAPR